MRKLDVALKGKYSGYDFKTRMSSVVWERSDGSVLKALQPERTKEEGGGEDEVMKT